MSLNQNDKARKMLFEALEETRAVMLGANAASSHMMPMAPQFDEDDNERAIWFFTTTTSELGSAAHSPIRANICLISRDEDVYACINGQLVVDHNDGKIEKFWSPVVAAWFEGGREDPEMTMLRFSAEEAAVWVNEANAAKFGFEIAKANLARTTPDLGYHTLIHFD